jgi:dTDP-4-amino-4,6-dideoxygalactose transaminase
MAVPMYDAAAQYYSMREEIDSALARVLTSATLTLGPELADFEREFAAMLGRAGSVGVGSGSDALVVALRALNVGEGDEVIAPPNSCVSVVGAIVRTGAQPRLVDVDGDRLTLDPNRIEASISPRTRAIVVIHAHGTPADLDPIVALADRYQIPMIEDCSQATGATYRGRRVGTLGRLACSSLSPSKILAGVGDGGIVVCDEPDLLHRMRLLRNHGRERFDGESHLIGGNTRLDELSAAVLRTKLKYLDQFNAARRKRAQQYANSLARLPVKLPSWPDDCEPAFNQFVVRVENRDRVVDALQRRGVAARMHYAHLAHLSPAFRQLGHHRGDFPVAERCAQSVLSLPIYPELSDESQAYVCQVLGEVLPSGKAPLNSAGSEAGRTGLGHW